MSLERQQTISKIASSEKYGLIVDEHFCNNIVAPGTIGFNAGHIWNVDNTDLISVSKALVHGRKIASKFRNALAEVYPKAFANAFVATTASLMGVRETRRIIGDYILSLDDYMERRSFEDEICKNSYFITSCLILSAPFINLYIIQRVELYVDSFCISTM